MSEQVFINRVWLFSVISWQERLPGDLTLVLIMRKKCSAPLHAMHAAEHLPARMLKYPGKIFLPLLYFDSTLTRLILFLA